MGLLNFKSNDMGDLKIMINLKNQIEKPHRFPHSLRQYYNYDLRYQVEDSDHNFLSSAIPFSLLRKFSIALNEIT
jgi:hypothetical protein